MNAQKNDSSLGVGLVLGSVLMWGTVGPAQILAASNMGPLALGGWRLLVGGLALGAFTVRDFKKLRALTSPPLLRPLLVCALSTALYQATFLYSVSRTGAALATVIALGTAPAAIGVCTRWITGDRVNAAWVVSNVTAIAGCILLLAPGSNGADPLGLLLGVAAGICYGLYTVFAKRLAADNPALPLPAVSALSLTVGAVVLLPWIITDNADLLGFRTLGLIAWLGLAATALAYWLFTVGLSRVSATTVGTLSLAEPLAAALLGILVLDEHLSGSALAGCALIFGGLAATCLPRSRRRSPSPDAESHAETQATPAPAP
ncbi:DMT family transporter [Streptomyces sp. NPDC057199]|uniref:DMT family transporter n=1 Tax=Streptomyces sp. NPDC057199 TaxID=3346047 RepID=UPI003643CE73